MPGLQLGAALLAAFVLPGNLVALVAGSVLAVVSPMPVAGFVVLALAEVAWLLAAAFSARREAEPVPDGARPPALDLAGRLEDAARQRVDAAVGLALRLVEAGADADRVERAVWALLRLEAAVQGLSTFVATTEPAQVRRLRVGLRGHHARLPDPGGPVGRALQQALGICERRLAWFERADAWARRLEDRGRALAGALDDLAAAPREAGALEAATADAEEALDGLPFADGPRRAPAGLLPALAPARV